METLKDRSNAIVTFAKEHGSDTYAATALMEFCRGECRHNFRSINDCCVLCGKDMHPKPVKFDVEVQCMMVILF
jgi:hypothetical protein